MLEVVWDDLKYFALVGRMGSVAMASKLSRVEHSTIARRITRLEAALDLRLFNRMARAWRLTEEGEALLARAVLVEDQILNVRKFASSFDGIRGTVCVTAPPLFLSEIIAPALSEFYVSHPQIDLCLIGDTRDANLSRGEADIAFRMSPVSGAELVTRTVCNIRYEFFGLRKWQDIPSEKRLFIGYSENYLPSLYEELQRQIGERHIISCTNDLRVALRYASAGTAIALLPQFLVPERSELTVIETPTSTITSPVQLVMQQDIRKAPRVRAVAAYLCSHIRSWNRVGFAGG